MAGASSIALEALGPSSGAMSSGTGVNQRRLMSPRKECNYVEKSLDCVDHEYGDADGGSGLQSPASIRLTALISRETAFWRATLPPSSLTGVPLRCGGERRGYRTWSDNFDLRCR